MRLLAPAKINLYLKVLARREDGYHDIESLVLPVSLCDLVCVERTGSGIEVRCDHPGCPDGEGNLAHRAARWFFDVSGISGCVRIG
ncbi:MAG TPA: 4-(cytidine 5'-diphospho)-2-C-methyl-D-erythritol kinase, partial [Proteobacteria bacterium]|nr:4-(cytidine 5'-diphospho)-2-C-methyl-D-erythritol kinase [Pseudomonadota bacterium]